MNRGDGTPVIPGSTSLPKPTSVNPLGVHHC